MNERNENPPAPTVVADDLAEFLECVDLMKKHMRIERASLIFSEKEYFWWNGRAESALPDEQKSAMDDLLETASGIRFDQMSAATKQIVWKGVRFYYGLSVSDLPYPVYLDAKPGDSCRPFADPLKRQPRQFKPKFYVVAILAFVVCAVVAGMLSANALLPSASQNPTFAAPDLSKRLVPLFPSQEHSEQNYPPIQLRSSPNRAP